MSTADTTVTWSQSPASAAPSVVLERIRALSSGLTTAEQRVARTVLRAPTEVIHQSVNELAQAAEVSPATVVRFCQSAGLRGYQELKLALARETIPLQRQLLDEVGVDDGPHDVVHKVLTGAANALLDAARSVDADQLADLADRVARARRVLFVAVGTSAPLAADAAYRFTTVGISAQFTADPHMQHVLARMLGPDDLCFAISHTGSTIETLAAMRAAAAAGAVTVAITSFAQSPLTDIVAHTVVAGSRETAYRIEAMTSRFVHISVLDALFALLVLHGTRSTDALSTTAEVLIEHRI